MYDQLLFDYIISSSCELYSENQTTQINNFFYESTIVDLIAQIRSMVRLTLHLKQSRLLTIDHKQPNTIWTKVLNSIMINVDPAKNI